MNVRAWQHNADIKTIDPEIIITIITSLKQAIASTLSAPRPTGNQDC
jgi:hypothetical protein